MPRARRKALKILILLVASIITLKLCVTRRLESPSLRKVSLSESIVCGCPERLVVKAETTDNFISTCSQEATSRGPGTIYSYYNYFYIDLIQEFQVKEWFRSHYMILTMPKQTALSLAWPKISEPWPSCTRGTSWGSTTTPKTTNCKRMDRYVAFFAPILMSTFATFVH